MIALLLALGHPAVALTGADYVMVARNGVDAQVFDGLNAAHGTDKISLYNTLWGASINPNAFNIIAVVNDDRIISIRPYNTTGAVAIPQDSWVIAVNGIRLPLLSSAVVEDGLRVRPTDTCNGVGVPALVLHDLGATSTNFEAILDDLQADGYETITLAQLEDWMTGAGSLPTNPILLTFDDGYDSHFSFGVRELHDRGMSGVFFIITNRPGTNASYATWAEINTGLATYPGAAELGCHSHAAHDFHPSTTDGKYLHMTEVERAADLASCTSTLLAQTGITPTSIAWPFGDYDLALVEDAQAAGYTLIFTTQLGLNVPQNWDALGRMRRLGLNGATGEWSTVTTELARWYVCD